MSRAILEIEGVESRVEASRRLTDGSLAVTVDGAPVLVAADAPEVRVARAGEEIHVEIGGEVWIARLRSEIGGSSADGAGAQGVIAPMNGEIVSVTAAVGDVVEAGAELVVLESMKLHMSLPSPRAGRVAEVLTAPRQIVSKGELLVRLADDDEESASAAD